MTEIAPDVEPLYGPHLEKVRPKGRPRKPISFPYTTRFNVVMATAVDKLAAEKGVKACDVIRMGMAYFLRNIDSTENVATDISPSADSIALSTPTPVQADRWRGDGRSDLPNIRRVNQANSQRKADGRKGERLKDNNPVR